MYQYMASELNGAKQATGSEIFIEAENRAKATIAVFKSLSKKHKNVRFYSDQGFIVISKNRFWQVEAI